MLGNNSGQLVDNSSTAVAMEVDLNRNSEPQLDNQSAGINQSSAQALPTAPASNNREKKTEISNDINGNVETATVKIYSNQQPTMHCTTTESSRPRVSGRVASKGRLLQRAPGTAGPSGGDLQQPNTSSALVDDERELEQALEIEAEGEITDSESASSSDSQSDNSNSDSESTNSDSSAHNEQPEQPSPPRPRDSPRPRCSVQAIHQLPERTEWVDEATTQAIRDSIDRSGPPKRGSCRICGYRGALRRVRIHVKQHQLRYYCPCKSLVVSSLVLGQPGL